MGDGARVSLPTGRPPTSDPAGMDAPRGFSGSCVRQTTSEREAKIVASLNHPGIAAVGTLGKGVGQNFLVLEYVEGQTLASQPARGPGHWVSMGVMRERGWVGGESR